MIYLEDIALGQTEAIGSFTFTAEAIRDFARHYDPQPFHLDEAAAAAGPFGRLAASGWHTCAIWMKLMVAHRTARAAAGERIAAGVSPGFLDLRWERPVHAGETIRFTATPIERVALKSRPDLGILKSRNEGFAPDGARVLHFIGQGFMPRRPGPSDQPA